MSRNVRHYRPAWEAEPQFSGWLTCMEGDGTKAFCKLCKCSLQAHKKDLSNHASCKKHLQASKFTQIGSSCSKIAGFFGVSISEERKISELKIAAFIAEHCSVSTVDHLGVLLPTLDKSSTLLAGIKLHHTKCAGLITNVISPCMHEDLLKDIGDSAYSMIIDESTSVDVKKTLCLIIRYFSQERMEIKTTFYKLLEIQAGDAKTLADTFKKQLIMDGLDINKLIGIGVDGANVMVGENHSFASILKESVPHLEVIKCVSHSLHLAAENACKVLPMHLDYIVRECHNWFSCSTKRQIEYALLYETLAGKKPVKIDRLSGTRWLARIGALTKILEQWDALELHFQIAKDKERCYTAGQLHLMLSSKANKMYFVFLRHFLKPITDCNRMFQSDNVERLLLFNELNNLLLNYLSVLIPPERLNSVKQQDLSVFNFQDFIMNLNCIHLGYSFNEEVAKLPQSEVKIIKEKCVNFLSHLCMEIQKRIPNNLKILKNMSCFSAAKATSQVRPDIRDFVDKYKGIVGAENVDSVLNEWRVLPFQQWKKVDQADTFWGEVSTHQNAAGERTFFLLSKFVTSILCLPFSNASVERAFSIMNLVKNKLRNKMLTETADHIIRLRYNLQNGGCVEFQPTQDMIKKFKSEEVYKITNSLNNDAVKEFWDIINWDE